MGFSRLRRVAVADLEKPAEPGGEGRYLRDAANDQTLITTPSLLVTTIGYDPLHREIQRQYSSGVLTTQTWDPAGNLSGITNNGPSGLISRLAYAYNPANQGTVQAENDGTVTTWTYDRAYQITNENRAGGPAGTSFNVTHTYDHAGNPVQRNDGTTLTTYTYSPANKLTLANAGGVLTTYTNDAAGNRTAEVPGNGGSSLFAWDAPSRMVSADVPAGIMTLTYNTDGQRVAKQSTDGSVTGFLYDHKRLLQETDEVGGDITKMYASSTTDEFGDLIGEDGEFTHVFDAQANTNALLDTSGQVEASYKYDAFGQVAAVAVEGDAWASLTVAQWANLSVDAWAGLPVELTSNMLAGGKKQYYLDPETELYLLGSGTNGRYYDASIGRFVSEDPIRQAGQDPNLFGYVKNDPVNKLDPNGQQASDDRARFLGPPAPVDIFIDFPNADFVLRVIFGWDRGEVEAHRYDPDVLTVLALNEYQGPVVLDEPPATLKVLVDDRNGLLSDPSFFARWEAQRSGFTLWQKAENYPRILARLEKELREQEEQRAQQYLTVAMNKRDRRLREILRPLWRHVEAERQKTEKFFSALRASIAGGASADQALKAVLGGKREATPFERLEATAIQESVWRASGPQLREGENLLGDYEERDFAKQGLLDALWRQSWAPELLSASDKALIEKYDERVNEARRVKSYWQSRDQFKEEHGAFLDFFDRLLDPYSGMPSGWDALMAVGGMAADARAQAQDMDAYKEAIVIQRAHAEIGRLRELKGSGPEFPSKSLLDPTLATGDWSIDLSKQYHANLLERALAKGPMTPDQIEWLLGQVKALRDDPAAAKLLLSGGTGSSAEDPKTNAKPQSVPWADLPPTWKAEFDAMPDRSRNELSLKQRWLIEFINKGKDARSPAEVAAVNLRNWANADCGLEREKEYRTSVGGTNKILQTPLGDRQIDVYLQKLSILVQIKTGPEALTTVGKGNNQEAIEKDKWLRSRGNRVIWVLEKGGSKPLLTALKDAGIEVFTGPNSIDDLNKLIVGAWKE